MIKRVYLLIAILFFMGEAFAQKIDYTKETVITRVLVNISMAVKPDEDKWPLFDAGTIFSLNFQSGTAGKQVQDSTFILISQNLQAAGINLKPIESLNGMVTYTKMGYPAAGISKASKKSDFQQFVSIDFLIDNGDTPNSLTIEIELKFGDQDGKKIQTNKGKAIYAYEPRVDAKYLGYYVSLNEAIDDLLNTL